VARVNETAPDAGSQDAGAPVTGARSNQLLSREEKDERGGGERDAGKEEGAPGVRRRRAKPDTGGRKAGLPAQPAYSPNSRNRGIRGSNNRMSNI
jgi:hypothetical protein